MNANGRLRMHDGRLRTYDEIVQSKMHISVHVAFSYCNDIAHEQGGIEKSQLNCQ